MTAPALSWSEALLEGLAAHLAAAGVGAWRPTGPAYTPEEVGIVLDELLDAPDRLVALASYDLPRDVVGVPDEVPVDLVAVQVRTRAAPGVRGARALDDAVYAVLDGAEHVDAGGVHVLRLWRVSSAPLGRDGVGRRERVSNYYALAQRPTAHRPQ